ncbi:hypothetical protein [Staphylococcus succinus]|uniref:hypothetical protein n=1 Tax=Staphylococcus TaxID=1279 RepID=UPI003F567C06
MNNKYNFTSEECLSVLAWEGIVNLCAGIKENELDNIVKKNKGIVNNAIITMISELSNFSLVFSNDEVDYKATEFLESVNNSINDFKNTLDKIGIIKYNAPNLFDLLEYIEYLVNDEFRDKTEGTMQEILNNVQSEDAEK